MSDGLSVYYCNNLFLLTKKLISPSLVGAVLAAVFACACASTPAIPPDRDAIESEVRGNGADKTYAKYRVAVDGNAFLGHRVIVGGLADNSAPARNYFNGAAFDVDHLNNWAHWTSTLLLVAGSAVTTLSSVLLISSSRYDAPLYVLCGCALPTMLCGLGFSYVAGWDMDKAADDYNTKLRAMIDEAAGKHKPGGSQASSANDDEEQNPTDSEQAGTKDDADSSPEPDEPEMAPFDY